MKRIELAKVIITAFGIDIMEKKFERDLFPDTSWDQWYRDYLYTVYEKRIMKWYNDGKFRPIRTVSRAEALKVVLLASGISKSDIMAHVRKLERSGELENPFSDVAQDAWYYYYVLYAYNMGIVEWRSQWIFAPDMKINRAETSRLILNTLRVLDTEFTLDI